MKNVYLVFAIVGAVVPYFFFVQFFADSGINLPAFISALFANSAAAGFTADLLITSLVFWIYMFNRSEGPAPWLFIALNLSIGLSCALPAYIYAVTKNREGAPGTG